MFYSATLLLLVSPSDPGHERCRNLFCFCRLLCLLPTFGNAVVLLSVYRSGFLVFFHMQVMILVLGAKEHGKQLRAV